MSNLNLNLLCKEVKMPKQNLLKNEKKKKRDSKNQIFFLTTSVKSHSQRKLRISWKVGVNRI